MKTIVFLITLAGLCAVAGAEDLSTADGTTYRNITKQRVDPDGLYIEYTPASGGMGMAKVKFARLSPEQQKQFGYDAAKASAFEAENAKAQESFRAQAWQWSEAARAAAGERDRRDAEENKAQVEGILAQAQLTAAQAELARASGGISVGDGGYYGAGYSLYAIPPVVGSLRSYHGGLEVTPRDNVASTVVYPPTLRGGLNYLPGNRTVIYNRTQAGSRTVVVGTTPR